MMKALSERSVLIKRDIANISVSHYSNSRFTALMYQPSSQTGLLLSHREGQLGLAVTSPSTSIHRVSVLDGDMAQPLPLELLQAQAGCRQIIYLIKWGMSKNTLQELGMYFSNTFQAQRMPRKYQG